MASCVPRLVVVAYASSQTIDRARADDTEPRDRRLAMDLVVAAQRLDELSGSLWPTRL